MSVLCVCACASATLAELMFAHCATKQPLLMPLQWFIPNTQLKIHQMLCCCNICMGKNLRTLEFPLIFFKLCQPWHMRTSFCCCFFCTNALNALWRRIGVQLYMLMLFAGARWNQWAKKKTEEYAKITHFHSG